MAARSISSRARPRDDRLRVGGQVGSFGERAAWLGAEVAHQGDAALVAYRSASARNDYPYLDNAGTTTTRSDDYIRDRPNADYGEHDAWAIGRTSLGKRGARLTTVFNAFQREQGVTGLGILPALAARSETARELAGLSARLPCGVELGCELVLGSQATTARTRLTDPGNQLGLFEPRLDSRGTRVGQNARLSLGGRLFRLLLGANVEFEQLALGRREPAARATQHELGSPRGIAHAEPGYGVVRDGAQHLRIARTAPRKRTAART